MTTNQEHDRDRSAQYPAVDLWIRRVATLAVAGVAGYASYQHQRDFAFAGGADLTTARLWPLSVDGLLVLSTAGLLRDSRQTGRHARAGRSAPTGAELDKVAHTNNYGRAVLRKWQRKGYPPAAAGGLLADGLDGRKFLPSKPA